MHLELIILEGSHAGRQIPLVRTPLTFGRSSAAGMSFPLDSFMSGMHLTVQHALSCVVLIDLRSSNGTFLNGERIRQAIAVPGDIIRIGMVTMKLAMGKAPPAEIVPVPEIAPALEIVPLPEITSLPLAETIAVTTLGSVFPVAGILVAGIPVAAEEPVVAPSAEPTVEREPESAVQANPSLFELLRHAGPPLFCLIDTAGDKAILPLLESASDRRESLCGDKASAYAPLSRPYLVQIDSDSLLLQCLVAEGWGRGWASFFTSTASFEELSGHFGRFYQVQAEAGEVYFRFYDPKVLREFLPVASPGELKAFFGPVGEWLLEAEDGIGAITASNGAGGLLIRQVGGR